MTSQGRRKDSFIPRTAKLELRISGVPVFQLRLESSQARTLKHVLDLTRDRWVPLVCEYPKARDEDVADAIIAALLHNFGHLEDDTP